MYVIVSVSATPGPLGSAGDGVSFDGRVTVCRVVCGGAAPGGREVSVLSDGEAGDVRGAPALVAGGPPVLLSPPGDAVTG